MAANLRPCGDLEGALRGESRFPVEFRMCAEIVQNGSLISAETEIVRVSLNFHGAKMQLGLFAAGPSRARTVSGGSK